MLAGEFELLQYFCLAGLFRESNVRIGFGRTRSSSFSVLLSGESWEKPVKFFELVSGVDRSLKENMPLKETKQLPKIKYCK